MVRNPGTVTPASASTRRAETLLAGSMIRASTSALNTSSPTASNPSRAYAPTSTPHKTSAEVATTRPPAATESGRPPADEGTGSCSVPLQSATSSTLAGGAGNVPRSSVPCPGRSRSWAACTDTRRARRPCALTRGGGTSLHEVLGGIDLGHVPAVLDHDLDRTRGRPDLPHEPRRHPDRLPRARFLVTKWHHQQPHHRRSARCNPTNTEVVARVRSDPRALNTPPATTHARPMKSARLAHR